MLHQLYYLISHWLLTRFYNLSLTIFPVIFSVLFFHFSVTDLMWSLFKKALWILGLLKAQSWPNLFLLYIIFLMMISVALLSLLIILLSTVNIIRLLICNKSLSWLLNLNLCNVSKQSMLTNFSPCCILQKKRSFNLHCKLNDWFLYEM